MKKMKKKNEDTIVTLGFGKSKFPAVALFPWCNELLSRDYKCEVAKLDESKNQTQCVQFCPLVHQIIFNDFTPRWHN